MGRPGGGTSISTSPSTYSAGKWSAGWSAPRESATLAERLIATSCERQRIRPDQLTVHAGLGAPMTSKSVALLLVAPKRAARAVRHAA